MGGFRVGVTWDSDWNSGPHHSSSFRRSSEGNMGRSSSMSDLAHRAVSHQFEKLSHYAHLVPQWTMSMLALLIGAVMACVAWVMTQCDVYLVFKKFQLAQRMLTDVHWASALLFLWVTSALMAASAAALVIYIHPQGAGSGLPELKAYANGNGIDQLYGHFRNWVRGVGAVLATGAGLCTGREGPVVSLGGSVGVALTRMLTLSQYKEWIDQDIAASDQESMELDLRSYARCKRLGCMMGGAAGLTAVFNAPLGATLYMLEEVTVTAWSTQTTFHVLGAAIISKIVMRLLMNLNGEEVHSIIVYDNHQDRHSTYDWGFIDLPFFAVVGLLGGALGALYSRGSIMVWRLRNKSRFCRRRQKSKRLKIIEVIIVAICSITVMFLVPLAVRCSHALLDELEERVFVRHFCNCDKEVAELRLQQLQILHLDNSTLNLESQFCGLNEGSAVAVEGSNETESGRPDTLRYVDFNVAATYLLQGTEGAIKQLYSRDYHVGEEFTGLVLTFTAYGIFALAVAGLPMPTGTFIPNMFMGAVMGRMMPLVVGAVFKGAPKWLADPGVYAVVGSASMLAGFTHMTIAISSLLVEVTLDLYMSGPILVGVLAGRFMSRIIQHYDFNEALILLKGVTYLEAECPPKVHECGITAGDCHDMIPAIAMLSQEAERKSIHMALSVRPKVLYFPLLDSDRNICIGLIPRSRLEVILRGGDNIQSELNGEGEEDDEPDIDDDDKVPRHPLFEEDLELEIGHGPAYDRDPVNLFGLTTPTNHSITEDTLIAHAWPLLARMALDKVCVLAQPFGEGSNQPMSSLPSASSLMGILDRRHLVRLAEEHYHI